MSHDEQGAGVPPVDGGGSDPQELLLAARRARRRARKRAANAELGMFDKGTMRPARNRRVHRFITNLVEREAAGGKLREKERELLEKVMGVNPVLAGEIMDVADSLSPVERDPSEPIDFMLQVQRAPLEPELRETETPETLGPTDSVAKPTKWTHATLHGDLLLFELRGGR